MSTSTYAGGRTKTYEAGGAISQYARVKLSSGKLAVSVKADTVWLGTIAEASFADGDHRDVILRNAQGTQLMIASGAISDQAKVYTDAAGKVSATSTSATLIGYAHQAATADGDIIEVMPV